MHGLESSPFYSERNLVSTEQLDLQHILAVDPNNSGDGVLERLELQLVWLANEVCYRFFSSV